MQGEYLFPCVRMDRWGASFSPREEAIYASRFLGQTWLEPECWCILVVTEEKTQWGGFERHAHVWWDSPDEPCCALAALSSSPSLWA